MGPGKAWGRVKLRGAMLATRLSEFAQEARPDANALAVMRLCLFDWSACAWAGRDQAVARVLVERARAEAGARQAGLVGQGFRVPARMAAMVNGTIGHALDYDDTHFAHIGHPSAAVVPAALAVAQSVDARGEAMLAAALVGAEASVRIGVWLGRAHYQAGFHQTATAGAFGATLAAARLLGLDARTTGHALGIVSTRASGLKSQFGTMGKPLNAGIAAANGVEAALLAQAGLESAAGALDGAQGFGETHHGQADPAALDGLGETWLMNAVSYKFHACCHGLHAMLEALAPLADTIGARRVERVVIRAHPRWKDVCNISDPADGLQSKFSFRQAAALRLAGVDTASLAAFSDETARDLRVAQLRGLVEVTFCDRMSEAEACVAVHLEGGETLGARHDLADPLAHEELSGKLRQKAQALIGPERAGAVWAAIQSGPDLQGLVRALTTQHRPGAPD